MKCFKIYFKGSGNSPVNENESQDGNTAARRVKQSHDKTGDQSSSEVQAPKQRKKQPHTQDEQQVPGPSTSNAASLPQSSNPAPPNTDPVPPNSDPTPISNIGSSIVGHNQIQVTDLKDIPNHEVPYKFRIRVRMMEYHPKTTVASDFLRLFCPRCQFLSILPDSPATIESPDSWAASAEPDYVELTDHGNLPKYKCPKCSKGNKHKAKESRMLEYIYFLRVKLIYSMTSTMTHNSINSQFFVNKY